MIICLHALITGRVFSCRILIRPHPAIWRLVHGMAVVYLVSLTFLLFQVSMRCSVSIIVCGSFSFSGVEVCLT